MQSENEVQETNKDVEIESFDLPEVESSRVAPRIHMAPGDSACVSCEG